MRPPLGINPRPLIWGGYPMRIVFSSDENRLRSTTMVPDGNAKRLTERSGHRRQLGPPVDARQPEFDMTLLGLVSNAQPAHIIEIGATFLIQFYA
jgi:hypothetical protein